MPSKVGRNYLNLCFSKLKIKPLPTQSPSPTTHTADHHRPTRPFSSSSSATTAATFITNYNSLYEVTNTFDTNSTSKPSFFAPAANNDSGDPDAYVAVDFITAFTSHRFFFSSPGYSNSIIESATPTTATAGSTTISLSSSSSDSGSRELLLNNSLAIPTYSPDPYADFRRSMQEMVEAREARDEIDVTKSSWEFLHEILLCYLALNPKSTHKHILKAFADLARVIKPPLSSLPPLEATEKGGGREAESAAGGGCEISSQ